MKSINILLQTIILMLLPLLSGCSDFLERNHPTGITDDNFWTTTNQAVAALGACKHMPRGTYYYDAPYIAIMHMEGMTDNMYHAGNFKSEIVSVGNGSVAPTTGGYIKDIWSAWYTQIRKCNRLLANIHKPYFTDEKERKRIIAEARVWRAWYHMQLLMYYGLYDGVPIVDKVLAANEIYMARNTPEECLKFINDEFDAVINSTDLEFLWDEGRRDRMSISIALALKMQVNLQFKKYDVAKQCALDIIKENKFELYYSTATDNDPGKNYRDLFRYVGKQNKERILFCPSGLSEFWFRSMSTVLGGQGAACPLKSLVDTYETIDGKTIQSLSADERAKFEKEPLYKDRDPRLFATVMLPGDNKSVSKYIYEPFNSESSDYLGKPGASRSGFMTKKFLDEQDRPSPAGGSLDYMLIRYAEVLLTYVECLVESGDWKNPDVQTYINMIRKRAGMPDMDMAVYNTQEKVRELYRRERRVELSFEGKRYFDIRRWGIGEQTMKGRAEGAWNPLTSAFVVVEERAYSIPKNDIWPLSQDETTANPNIKQPTGWN